MPFDLDSNDITTVRAHLGFRFDELRETMLDLGSFPSDLFSDDRPRILRSRAAAIQLLDQWVAAEPTATNEIYTRLPDLVQRHSLSESLLEAATWWDYDSPLIELFNYPATESRAFAAVPSLVPLLDESGLIEVTGLDARPWGLHIGGYALHYHQLLRRGFGSRIHYGLIATVLRAARQHHLTARFALDERRIQFKDEYREILEFDYWYGPSPNEADLDNLGVVGETFHGDPDGGTSLLNPYAGLSVRWTADGDLKAVEIEESMPLQNPTSEWVFARYLHAIRDTSKRAFIHCDGAVKAYATDKYPQAQHDFKNRGKGDRYRKLFRIDGKFPAAVWSELACSWFRGNRLINEYFADASE
ncbi:MAG: hypothetical protein IIZ13_00390 [Renibacterium sp.]|nr:hypothetical protein [Renibacterium sp.]